MSQHDFDPTKLGGQPLPPQGGLLRDLEGCAARLAQQISTTPVDATEETFRQDTIQKLPLRLQRGLRSRWVAHSEATGFSGACQSCSSGVKALGEPRQTHKAKEQRSLI